MNEGFDSPTRYKSTKTVDPQGFSATAENPDNIPDAIETKKLYQMRTDNFKPPRTYRGAKEWFVEYYFLNPHDNTTWDRFRIRAKINYEHDLKKRNYLAVLLQKRILQQLRAGKIPAKYLQTESSANPEKKLIPVLEKIAASEAIGKSQDTKNGYRLMIARLKKYLDHIKMPQMLLQEFPEDRAQEFKEFLMEEMELKNVTVNCTIQPIKSFLEKLFIRKEITINPFYNVKYLPKHRGSTFIAFDDEEKKKVSDHLRIHNPELYLFSNFIYSCYIRPKELCALTPRDIDIKREFVQVRIETSKVAHTSYRQILPRLKQLILDYNILSLPKDQPIFRSICGDESSLRKRRRRVTDLWKQEIKEGLKIDKEMYGLKHTGNIDYLKSLDNVGEANLLWLKQQNDHTTLETTQNYIRDLGVYKIKKENISFGII